MNTFGPNLFQQAILLRDSPMTTGFVKYNITLKMNFAGAILVGMAYPVCAIGGIATGCLLDRGSLWAIFPFGLALAILISLQVVAGAQIAFYVTAQTIAMVVWVILTVVRVRSLRSFNKPPQV
jgi:hypothetical protein